VIRDLGRPHNVAVDAKGNIYTANPGNKGVRKVARK
jgi:sugar lactone lactonase YvrE